MNRSMYVISPKELARGRPGVPVRHHLKYGQPQAEIVVDYPKVATLGLNNAQIGADLGAALGGDDVNRFNIGGRAYEVIPQIARAGRVNRSRADS